MTRYLAVILVVGIILPALSASERSLNAQIEEIETVQQAVETYQSALNTGDRDHRVQLFGRAEAMFARIIEQQLAAEPDSNLNSQLYLNLGNAALGAEHLGPAIVAYRRALLARPNDQRARQNLQHARTLLPQWVPTPDESVSFGSFFSWARGFRHEDWFGFAAIAFLVMSILLAIHIHTGRTAARNLAILVAIVWIGALGQSFPGNSVDVAEVAVVVIPEVMARSADSVNAPVRFPEPLPGGTELQVVDERNEWLRIRLFDSREAWLPRSAVEKV